MAGAAEELEGFPDVTVAAMLSQPLLPTDCDAEKADEGEDEVGNHQSQEESAHAGHILDLGVAQV